ncbi:MAG: ankyrin repeat domain-containing protein [Actinophytocola sp.]|uniref:ankyrin repeat domain-containing protein n=1 Tax=Actinophytocola sp. TaxID=1872138 RepID=UPI003C7773DC
MPVTIGADDPLAVAVTTAIRTGDLAALDRLLADHPELATARIREHTPNGTVDNARTLLHVATDWPGHFPHGPATVAVLVEAGADVNARFEGAHRETPLHWAASSDDVDVIDALLDAGADIEAPGAVTDGGTPLCDATAFAQWRAAFRLVERGATTTIFTAATLGLQDRVAACFTLPAPPGPTEINAAFWGACHGGRLPTARYLAARGADINWIAPWEPATPLDAAQRTSPDAHDLIHWLRDQGGRPARDPSTS